MSILNIMGNNFGEEQLEKFKAIKESKSLQSVCGIASDATEANLSGLGMDAADAAVLAEDIQDKGALSKMIFGAVNPVTVEIGMTELDCSKKDMGASGAIILAAWLQHK